VSDKKPRVLIIDDEPAVLRSLEMALEGPAWQVDVALTGKAAMERYAPGKYQLALIDKNLPDTTGMDIVRQIREEDQQMRVIMITGYPSLESAIDVANLGIDAYLQKPFRDIFAVRRLVEQTLAKQVRPVVGLKSSTSVDSLSTTPEPANNRGASGAARSQGDVKMIVAAADAGARERIAAQAVRLNLGVVSVPDLEQLTDALTDETAGVLLHGSLDGVEVLTRIRIARPKVKVFVVSERLDTRTVMELINLGVDGIIDVPDSSDAFPAQLARVASVLRIYGQMS
jgi:DNA-binding response OmpR family regulator